MWAAKCTRVRHVFLRSSSCETLSVAFGLYRQTRTEEYSTEPGKGEEHQAETNVNFIHLFTTNGYLNKEMIVLCA